MKERSDGFMPRYVEKNTGAAVAGVCAKVLACVLTFAAVLVLTVFLMVKIICATSEASRNTFVTTVLETGQMKFLASAFLPDDVIKAAVDSNSMKTFEEKEVNEGLITVPEFEGGQSVVGSSGEDSDEIEIIDIPGLTYKATMMIVKNPARVSLATICTGNDTWPEKGITLEEMVQRTGALAAINGGLYNSTNNSGGSPYGVVVSNGEIVRNRPQDAGGLVLIGLSDTNILHIVDVAGMSASECEEMIKERGIRDAVCFQEEASVDNNHFVQLIINGKSREISGAGSGLNPRTAIGQRADGALLLLVTDGRGYKGHTGASAADLIEIMTNYGAVNAANLDGGSSTCMYYDGEYLQNSVTFYYSQSSWRLPCAFIVT